jgi:hypothetical protein
MEPECLIPRTKESYTGPSTETDKFGPYRPILRRYTPILPQILQLHRRDADLAR